MRRFLWPVQNFRFVWKKGYYPCKRFKFLISSLIIHEYRDDENEGWELTEKIVKTPFLEDASGNLFLSHPSSNPTEERIYIYSEFFSRLF